MEEKNQLTEQINSPEDLLTEKEPLETETAPVPEESAAPEELLAAEDTAETKENAELQVNGGKAALKFCACSLCGKHFQAENPDVLALGGFGNPRYLCPDCAALLDRASLSRDPEEIEGAIRAVGETLSLTNNDDELTMTTVNQCLAKANDRKVKIEEGTYDFSEDEDNDGFELEDIPEELRETEEDAELDREDAEAEKKADKIWNMISIVAFAAIAVFVVLKFFVFK